MGFQVEALKRDLSIPLQIATGKHGPDGVGCSRLLARRIDVVYPQQPKSTPAACLQEAGEGRYQRAEMQGAGG